MSSHGADGRTDESGESAGEATIRIVLADDHAVVRSGLRMLLDSESGFEVVAEPSDVEGAARYVPENSVLSLSPSLSS